jgi:outer membrane autotransporter protein
VALNFSAGKTYSANVSVAHGGTGGSGGAGGEVDVTNSGAIQTMLENSPGILAQSIGGGGGNGGLSAAVTMSASTPSASTFNSAVSLGGKAGDGGASALVKVISTAAVSTAGDGSTGIEAQSIGGGGGDGGASVTGVLGLTTKNNYQLGLSVGGAGGGGGISGEVDVTTSGNVTTGGNQAVGILAQSIGGGGGDGGISFNGDLVINETKSLSVAVGGKGGKGGNGGVVNVATNGGAISTSGTDSHGLFAQSVGGGGGTGNLAGSGTIDFYGTEKYGVNLAVNVGGSGGVAGSGSAVAVTNKASVATSGEKAFGIYAQSVGGGGGEAGGGFTGHLNTELPESGFNWELGVSVGGNGGNGNNGGSVTVDNQGGLSTLGDKSHGIFAQSVGGGGGAGGDARDFSLVISEPSVKPEHVTSLYVGVGGKGGGSSSGGAVTVTNSAAIATQGDYAKGIFAQSVGGGGGEGGGNKGHSLRDTLIPGTVSISVGGAGGSSGNGGIVSVTNSGGITTSGEGAYGIQAQSVGGGGGVGGEGELGLLKLSIGIGGEAGGAGNGNTATVSNSGAITTSGDGAHGIFAQSVGGGGGTAGNVARFLAEYADIGIGIGWAPSEGGAGGNGGAVTVTNTSAIITHGASAYGILAQSVGGGGGEGGEVGYGPGAVVNYFMGSVGGAGSGGAVTVSHSGTITTTGDDSVGIFAQSAGGEGAGGAVNMTVGGNVLSSGANANGIQAQSLGLQGNGNIAIAINSGTVQGGTGGVGVVFMDGNANTLTNHGAISTLDGANGTAVAQQVSSDAPYHGSLTVNNYGTITGSVNQGNQALSKYTIQDSSLPTGAGTITFNNNAGAVFTAGSTVNLGSGTLTNSGTLNPGAGETRQTQLTGNYIQAESGVFDVTLNGDGSSGRLNVSGAATLAGTLRGLSGSGAFRNGTSYTVLTADGGISSKFSTFELHDTPLVSFITNHTPDAVRVQSSVQKFTTVAGSLYHRLLAHHLDTLLPMATGEFSQALREIQTMDGAKYEQAFESLSPGIYDAATITTFDVTRQYIRALQQRLQVAKGSGDASRSRKLGMWIQGVGQWGDRSSVDGFSGYDYSMGGTALGIDYAVSDRMAVGASFGYAYTSIDQGNSFANGSINSYFGSLYGTYFGDRAYLDGVLAYGNHNYDNNRAISIGSIRDLMSGDHDGNGFSLFVEGGYALPVGKWVVQPLVSVFYSYLDESGFRESGARDLEMSVGSRQTNYLVSEAGLRVSRPIMTSMGILTPEVKATWQHDFDVDDRIMPVTFAGAPLSLIVDGRKIGQDSAAVDAGFSFTSTGGITTSLKYNGILQDGYTAHSVMGHIQLSF